MRRSVLGLTQSQAKWVKLATPGAGPACGPSSANTRAVPEKLERVGHSSYNTPAEEIL